MYSRRTRKKMHRFFYDDEGQRSRELKRGLEQNVCFTNLLPAFWDQLPRCPEDTCNLMWPSCLAVSEENKNLGLHFLSRVTLKTPLFLWLNHSESRKCSALSRNEASPVIIFLNHSYKRKNADEERDIHYIRNYWMGHTLSKMSSTFAALIKYWRIVLGSLMTDFGKAKMAEANFPIALYKEGQSKSN